MAATNQRKPISAGLLLLSLLTSPLLAKPIDKDKALKAAQTFLVVRYAASEPNSVRTITKRGRSTLNVQEVVPLIVSNKLVGYVVDLEPAGFILFSGDDETPPVKTYSDAGSFEKLPNGFRKVLELELLEDNTTATSASEKSQHVLLKIKQFSGQWSYLTSDENRNNDVESFLTGAPGTSILTTTWHQNDPYNFYSPAATGGPGGRAWAGCTATALAQVLRHHKQPISVAQNHTYTDNSGSCTGTHSINDAGMGAYDWVNMPSSISTGSPVGQIQAVGQLIYHCAVALESNFEAGLTSAFPSSVPSVLGTFFNYTSGDYLEKRNYTSAQWYAKIGSDIDNNRPVFYAMWEADATPDGHAVVCDGYRNGNEIHLDLGWSGAWTAWYNIDTVPANGYTWTIHGAVFNITPATNHAPVLSNPRVNPIAGFESTTFEFLVDYYDPDGDPPHPDYRKVYISGYGEGNMTLKAGTGTESHGTYSYKTTLDCGHYGYWFFFTDTKFASDDTPMQYGPYVCTSAVELKVEVSGGPVTDNIEVEFCHGPDFPPSECQEWGATQLPQTVEVNPNEHLEFAVYVKSNNHTSQKWVFRDDNGEVVRERDGHWDSFILYTGNIHATAYLSYTPINYIVSGTVLRGDNSLVPGGVDLTLTSPVQMMSQHTDNGNFSFTGVFGGVPVTITPAAKGYQFSPSKLFFDNLKQDKTGQVIIAYAADNSAPMTSFLTVPPPVSENSSITFLWIGEDDVTAPGNLLYQFRLDPVDPPLTVDAPAWTANTSKSYDLANGSYTFEVRAKDEAANINWAPTNYRFVVNAKPRLISAVRVNNSIWASRVSVQMPPGATTFGTQFILLPEHSGINDPELIPVKIHRAGNPTACGANEMIASQVGLPPRITKAGTGYLLALPDSLWAGESAQYDIVWGKIKYFGWQEFTNVPRGFPNVPSGRVDNVFGWFGRPYLDEQLRLWRVAGKDVYHGVLACAQDGWLFMDMCTESTILIPETVLRFVPGECWAGRDGTSTEFDYSRILPVGSNICYLWNAERYEYREPKDYRYRRYGLQTFNSQGSTLCSVDGQDVLDASFDIPNRVIDNRLWIVVDQDYGFTEDLWFFVIDQCGNEVIPKTMLDTVKEHDFYQVCRLGENVLLLWERSWEAAEREERQEICYQVRNKTGGLVKPTTVINPPPLPDPVAEYDEYNIEGTLSDNQGKVWISYTHEREGQPVEFYYVIIGSNGNIWKGPIQTSSYRGFGFCDKDGYIWAAEGSQFFALNPDDTIAFGPRSPALIPNQTVGNIVASVAAGGYRLYDRWSPQPVGIDVPACADPNSMELFDLNLWDNELHPANLTLKKGNTVVWSQPGQFTGHTTADIPGVLDEGQNLLMMTQDDFLGGQVLITFPYTVDCFPSTYSTYGDWVLYGKPNCWCAPPHGTGYQCDGDADGINSGVPYYYRVYTGDIGLIIPNWRKKMGDPALNPCADIDHISSGAPYYYRVYTGDVARIIANWRKKDAGTGGTALPGNCPRPE